MKRIQLLRDQLSVAFMRFPMSAGIFREFPIETKNIIIKNTDSYWFPWSIESKNAQFNKAFPKRVFRFSQLATLIEKKDLQLIMKTNNRRLIDLHYRYRQGERPKVKYPDFYLK